ncbi:MAG: hypothetical protein ABFR62_11270 [Bacteroidota bacterium]
MIKEKIRVHGGESFEIDLGYLYKDDERFSTYDIDTYIYTPRSLDINKATYTKDEFFQDLKANIRFLTPAYNLNEVIEGDDSAYKKLTDSIDTFLTIQNKENAKQYRYHIKMFVSIFRSSLSKQVSRIVSKSSTKEKEILIEDLFKSTEKLVNKYRKLSDKLLADNVKEKEQNLFRFGDEFISYSIEKQFLILIRKLSRNESKYSKELHNATTYLEKELIYQRESGILSMNSNSKKSNENTIYRRGILRKFAEDRLFLNTRTEKEGVVMEQVIFSLAAGFAMIFATAVAFLSQKYYGNFTVDLFIMLVISYMAKDRIKELVRNNINDKIQSKYFFDNKTKIISGDEEIGLCRESFTFIEDKKIPLEVKRIRKREHLTEIENDWKGENVMRYHKRVKIYNKRFRKVFKEYEIKGIKDIVRLNVSRFTTKMSSPYLPLYAWNDKSKEVIKVKGEKVYHFNVVMVFKYNEEKYIKRYRIFLNKKGIKRIEKVVS